VTLPRRTEPASWQRRRRPRPLTAALVELLRTHRPTHSSDEEHIWVCLTPATAAAIAQIAARRAGWIERYRDHPAHEAARRPLRISATTASQWRGDAWRAAGEGLIDEQEALLLAAQIDRAGPP
jgi:hypothetical protein